MTEYRIVRPQEWEDCIELINYVFSYSHEPHDFERMLPKVYQAGPEMAAFHRAAVDEAGRLRALVAVLPEELTVAGKPLLAGYVGSVAVHPKARGQGHMKRLMKEWLRLWEPESAQGEKAGGSSELGGLDALSAREAADPGIPCHGGSLSWQGRKPDLLVLNGQRQRYGYFGFEPGGMHDTFEVNEANVRHFRKGAEGCGLSGGCFTGNTLGLGYTFAPLFSGRSFASGAVPPDGGSVSEAVGPAREAPMEPAEVFAARLNEARPARVRREAAQMKAILSTYGQEAWGVCSDGKWVGYLLCCGPDVITEMAFGGEADFARVTADYLAWRGISEVKITVPVYCREQIRQLGAFAEQCRLEQEGRYRILDYARVLEAYLKLKAETLGILPGHFSAVLEGQPVTVDFDGETLQVRRAAGADALALNRRAAHELLLSHLCAPGGRAGLSAEEWSRVPQDWFPLPLFWHMADEF